MDHMMPGMDGIEATKNIREIGTDYAKNIPIIALTANIIAGNEKMFLSKGFQDFLSKPIVISRLDAVIRHWVRDKSLEKSGEMNDLLYDNEASSVTDAPGTAYGNRPSIFDFRFEGIDFHEGLELLGGDSEIYVQVLRSFTANTRSLLDSIKEVNRENLDDYAITVHGIKGSARSICASLVGDMAETLEKAAKEGNLDFVCEKNPELMRAVVKLLENLDGMMDKLSAKAQKEVKTEPDRHVLAKILEACYNFDMKAVEEAVRELERFEYESGGELIPWLWESVQKFNINEIIDKLSQMNIGSNSL